MSNITSLSEKAAHDWRELTERVAKAAAIPVEFCDPANVYRDADGGQFDPVRDDGEAARLAIRQGINIETGPGFVLGTFRRGLSLVIHAEYDKNNDGDSMTSYRLAVCGAVLQQYKTPHHA